jgi:ketosteroid isomerase-like protein
MRMKKHLAARFADRTLHKVFLFLVAAALSLACVSPATAQKEKKKKKETPPPADSSNTIVPLTDEQQIDYMLSEMLGAWQLGDIEKLHKAYGDDVSIVNGTWAPPVMGWTNYLAIYQQQRARMQQVRMDRTNTYIKVNGTLGWACYQWEFAAVVDGQQAESQGQTTVVLEKRNNHWVIVHNHTSLAPKVQQNAPANTQPAQQPPAKPAER